MTGYRLSRAASDDILHIYLDGLEQFGLRQADHYHDGLTAAFAFLAAYPQAARLRQEITPPVRAYPCKAHIIVYEPCDDGGVLILRVRHGRESWISMDSED